MILTGIETPLANRVETEFTGWRKTEPFRCARLGNQLYGFRAVYGESFSTYQVQAYKYDILETSTHYYNPITITDNGGTDAFAPRYAYSVDDDLRDTEPRFLKRPTTGNDGKIYQIAHYWRTPDLYVPPDGWDWSSLDAHRYHALRYTTDHVISFDPTTETYNIFGVLPPQSTYQTPFYFENQDGVLTDYYSYSYGSDTLSGGVLAPNGSIYHIVDENILLIHKINPATASISRILLPQPLQNGRNNAFGDGILGPDGRIYFFGYGYAEPSFQFVGTVLRLDPNSDTVVSLGSIGSTSSVYRGFYSPVVVGNEIWAFHRSTSPTDTHYSEYITINTITGAVTLRVAANQSGSTFGYFSGPALYHPNGFIYMVSGNNLVRINPSTRVFENAASLTSAAFGSTQGTGLFLLDDGTMVHGTQFRTWKIFPSG